MNVNFSILLKRMQKSLTTIYCLLMFSFFLFYMQDGYFNITSAKHQCFVLLTLVYLLSQFVIFCIQIKPAVFLHTLSLRIHRLSITDWAMLVMLASHGITTLLSSYGQASLYGNAGRNLGLLFTLMIVITYFFISESLNRPKMVLRALICSSAIITLMGIINAYGTDPFHLFDRLQQDDLHRFLSTIGNVTFFAHLICLTLPFSLLLFYHTKNSRMKLLYGMLMCLGFCGIYISHVDGAFLGLAALFSFSFFYMVRSYYGCQCFVTILCLALFMMKVLAISLQLKPLYLDGISALFINSHWTTLLFLVSLGCLFYLHKRSDKHLPYHKLRLIFAGVLVTTIIACIAAIVYVTMTQENQDLGQWAAYLRFDDAWGSSRGFLWRSLVPFFLQKTSFLQKLFGVGLDCTRLIMIEQFGNLACVTPFDNAHNEYIQYLVTSGIIGLFSYLTIWLSLILRLCKRFDQKPYPIAIAAALITHGAWAITGVNQPITTPLLFLLFAIGEAYLRLDR